MTSSCHRTTAPPVPLPLIPGVASAAEGPSVKSLTPKQQREIDRQALAISHELGHERPQIVAVYCGS